jgi:hypothetical protein
MRLSRSLLFPLALVLLAPPGLGAEVTVNDADLIRLPGGVRSAAISLPPEDRRLPIVATEDQSAAATLLRKLDAEGRAHGFTGVVYDNRDRGHSALDPARFPRLTRLTYGFELVAENQDYGLAGALALSPVVFGNSSTAITGGPAPRSLPRFAMTRPGMPEAQARLYAGNDIYVYPEHRDHDAEDRFPANWPYMIISRGSSGSDQPFLDAIAMTLAAFPPETFSRMEEGGLVAPTLQAILRQNLASVTVREAYFSGAAHPVVFDAALLRPDRMVSAAAAMTPEDIPPLVRLAVESEGFTSSAGLAGLDERLFDTPSAIARIWRSPAWEQEMTLVAAVPDDERRDVTFTWRVLQGLPGRVTITPLDPEGRRARLRVQWHDAFVSGSADSPRKTSRSEIGVFAQAGGAVSAPAILSISFPAHESRRYGMLPGGDIGLLSVNYDAINRWAYFDPVLHWAAPWTDTPIRDSAGAITGWTRTMRDGAQATVPAAGAYSIDRSRPDQPQLVPRRAAP